MGVFPLNLDEPLAGSCRGGAVTAGNFAGVHRGHQHLIAHVREQARALPGPAVAVTFDPHPLQLLRPEQFQPVLTTCADRADLLRAAGTDGVVVLHTTPDLLNLGARAFFERVIRAQVGARAVVAGFNFAFGRDREGTVDTLADLCREAGLDFAVGPPLLVDGRPVSSSRVRGELVRGDVRQARLLLGRPYRLRGTVEVGRRRGQSLGFPTANVGRPQTLVPGDGVYVVRAEVGGEVWPGAANVGPNPTFGEQARKVEVHLIGFEGDLYGRELAVDFLDRLRDVRPFTGPEELVRQLREDVERARRLAGEPGKMGGAGPGTGGP
jgi:riboflavin kinase/FMN adenylyltransferase